MLFSKAHVMQKDSIEPFMSDFFTPSAKHYLGKTNVFTTAVRADDHGQVMQFKSELTNGELVVDFVFSLTEEAKANYINVLRDY